MKLLNSLSVDTSILALSCWLEGEAPDPSLRTQPETAEVVANTHDVLGEPTAIKRWLVTAFRKKMKLFRADDLKDTLAV